MRVLTKFGVQKVPDSWQPAGPTTGTGGCRMDDSGKKCWTNKPVFSSQQGDDSNELSCHRCTTTF